MKFELKAYLDKEDLGSIQDSYYDITNNLIDKNQAEVIFNNLPNHIKLEACKWGCDDTEVRESIYLFIKGKYESKQLKSILTND